MKLTKLIIIGLSLAALSAFAFVGLTKAQAVKTGNSAVVASGETIDSMLFATGNNVDIAGTVNGDVYCAGQNVTISGTIYGDVFCAGQTVNVTGKIVGSARLAGQSVNLRGSVDGSTTVAAQNFLAEKDSTIGRDLLGGTQDATLDGLVKRDVVAGATNLTINGEVGRNVSGGVENLTVGSVGKVGGNVDYTSVNKPVVKSGGQVAGTVTVKVPKKDQQKTSSFSLFKFTAFWFFYVLITFLIAALALVLLLPSIFNETAAKAIKSPGRTALIGLGAIILVPIAIFMLLVSMIGTPLGILALLMWIVVVLLSGPFAGYTLGRLMLKKSKSPVLIMLAGFGLLILLYFIPIIGFFVMLASYLFGVGMFLDEAMHRLPKPSKKLL